MQDEVFLRSSLSNLLNTGTLTVAVFQLSSLTAKMLLALSIGFELRSMTRSRDFPIPYPPETRGSIPSPLGG